MEWLDGQAWSLDTDCFQMAQSQAYEVNPINEPSSVTI